MATKYLIAATLLLATPNALAWSEADTNRQVAYTALHIIDWGQTLHIADDCVPKAQNPDNEHYFERNPALGYCPSRGDVNTYFALTGLAHAAVSYALPPKHRRWWQYVTIAGQATAVAHNFRLGLRVRF